LLALNAAKMCNIYTHPPADLSDTVHSSLIIMALMQSHGGGPKSWHTPKITVFVVP